jgi:hypothetical protein
MECSYNSRTPPKQRQQKPVFSCWLQQQHHTQPLSSSQPLALSGAGTGTMAAPQLLWEIVKGHNSFLRKNLNGAIFSAEPGNLYNKHSYKYSGGWHHQQSRQQTQTVCAALAGQSEAPQRRGTVGAALYGFQMQLHSSCLACWCQAS